MHLIFFLVIINQGITIHPLKSRLLYREIWLLVRKKKTIDAISGGIRIRVRGGGKEEIEEEYERKGGERERQKAKGEFPNKI